MSTFDYKVFPIEWLENYISDIKPFVKKLDIFFKGGGMLAGGSLLRAMERGEISSLFNRNRRWVIEYDPPSRLSQHSKKVDVDFFFRTPEQFEKTVDFFGKKHILNYKNFKKSFELFKYGKSEPWDTLDLTTGVTQTDFKKAKPYAPVVRCYEKQNLAIPANLVYIHCGEPEKILDTFDFVNCRILTDGERVWVHEDVLRLEHEKILKLANRPNGHTEERILKYLASGRYTKFVGKEFLLEEKEYLDKKLPNYKEELLIDNRIFETKDLLIILRKKPNKKIKFIQERKKERYCFPVMKQIAGYQQHGSFDYQL